MIPTIPELRELVEAIAIDKSEAEIVSSVRSSFDSREQLRLKRLIEFQLPRRSDRALILMWKSVGGARKPDDGAGLRALLRTASQAVDVELLDEIGRILADEWNPVWVADRARADEEYAGCISFIASMLWKNASPAKLLTCLEDMSKRVWRLSPKVARDRGVVEQLIAAFHRLHPEVRGT